ncbi:MAG TPA: hypothetical protein VNS32_26545 [Flavisolibacter sp.]|nr:hypothetical protein [Flavisolibacter sp.]
MFSSDKVYIQIFRNKITVVDLKTGNQVIRNAAEAFSSVRQVLNNFNTADQTIRSALKDLGMKKRFSGLKIVIQQMEGAEGGLSDIEKRAMRDLAETAGANKVYLVEHERPITTSEAIEIINSDK